MEFSILLVQRWKLIVIKHPQATNFAACLGRSQAGNLAIANIEWYKARSDRGHLISSSYFSSFSQLYGECAMAASQLGKIHQAVFGL